MKHLDGKNILVTGGAGSIGSEITRQLLKYGINTVRVFDNNETELFYLGEKEKTHLKNNKLRLFLGDIRDPQRIDYALNDVDMVFHCAALKHVPLCEYNPIEAIKTNTLGTINLIDKSIDKGVEKIINISTDKAVNPTSIMGTTKLLNEKLFSSAKYLKGKNRICFCSVRFGNVINTRGSIFPLFERQIKQENRINVTDMNMKRFMITKEQAAHLVLSASDLCKGGEIFILKMKEYSIGDIAKKIAEEKKVPINIIGNRGNEKLREELMTIEEKQRVIEQEDIYVIPSVERYSGGFIDEQ